MEPISSQSPKKVGRIAKGWQLTKSSWHVLKLDKELATLPIISLLVTIVALIPFGIFGLFNSGLTSGVSATSNDPSLNLPGWASALFALALYFVVTLIANFFGGAVIYGATERFRGGDPSVKSSINGAKRKFRPLALFSLMMATVGLALQTLEDRLPFAGALAVRLLNGAWSIANVFAIPVIVLSEEDVHPLDATKRSVQIIKQIWGESVVVNLGIGLISVFAIFGYLAVAGFAGAIIAAAVSSANVSSAVALGIGIPLATLAVLGFFALILTFSVLSSIAKAALYHYATTGEAPGTFEASLLRSAMTTKKTTRKMFG